MDTSMFVFNRAILGCFAILFDAVPHFNGFFFVVENMLKFFPPKLLIYNFSCGFELTLVFYSIIVLSSHPCIVHLIFIFLLLVWQVDDNMLFGSLLLYTTVLLYLIGHIILKLYFVVEIRPFIIIRIIQIVTIFEIIVDN